MLIGSWERGRAAIAVRLKGNPQCPPRPVESKGTRKSNKSLQFPLPSSKRGFGLPWEDPSLRPLASYFENTRLSGPGGGTLRSWTADTADIYSESVRDEVTTVRPVRCAPFSNWSYGFGF
jgi:hypothetical protein